MRTSTWGWLAGAAMLAGCSFEPAALQPVDGDGAPPLGPDASPADAAIDAAPPDAPPDRDGDNVIDPEDNCPEIDNEDQADCDGDGVGDACDDTSDGPDMDGDAVADACDNCPSMANPDQENMDEDQVGDICDPRPTAGGDTIAYFEGFDTDSDGPPPGWIVATGPELADAVWQVTSGALVPEPDTLPTIIYLSDVTLPADAVVETRGRTLGVLADFNAVASGGLVTRYTNAAPDTGAACTLEQSIDTTSTARVRLRNLADDLSRTTLGPWRAELDQVFTIVHAHHGAGSGDDSRCTVTPADPQLPPVVIASDDLPGPASGQVGLRVRRSRSAFDYVLVYGLGGPLPAP